MGGHMYMVHRMSSLAKTCRNSRYCVSYLMLQTRAGRVDLNVQRLASK